MPQYLCSFDMGTTSVKVGIVTTDGHVVGRGYSEYPVLFPGPKWVEQSIDDMWEGQCRASRQLLQQTGISPHEIAGIAVSAQRATFVPVDKYEKPLMNFIGWQDKRSVAQCDEIKEIVGARAYYDISGLPVEPTASVSKILWLREHEPDIYERTYKFYATGNMHLRQLGVENPPCDLPGASYVGLLDVDRFTWSDELLQKLEIPVEKMPSLVPSCTVVGHLSSEAAEATGLAAGTPLITAGADFPLGGLGVGVTEPGLVSLGIGTGAGILFLIERPLRHPEMGMGCLANSVPGTWEMEGICLASGGAHRWYRDVLGQAEREAAARLGVDVYDILSLQAAQSPAGARGVFFMPSLAGTGTPFWLPDARGAFLGLTLSTDKNDISRAVMEGVLFELRNAFESAEKIGTQISEVRLWGGAAKSPFWMQMAADIFGVPIVKSAVADTGLVGTAICAATGVGLFKSAREGASAMVRQVERYEPDPRTHERYNQMFGLYKDTYEALCSAGIYSKMSDFSRAVQAEPAGLR